ncbi:MAG: hypothetical protein Tsb0034_30220 [Ekhidna sp.]
MKGATLFLLALFLFIRCEDEDPAFVPVTITKSGDELHMLNNTENTYYYFIADPRFLALALWAPGVGEDQPKLEPRGQERVKLETISGYSLADSDTLIFNYWEAVIQEGELVAGPVDFIKVPL